MLALDRPHTSTILHVNAAGIDGHRQMQSGAWRNASFLGQNVELALVADKRALVPLATAVRVYRGVN